MFLISAYAGVYIYIIVSSAAIIESSRNATLRISQSQHPSHIPEAVAPRLIVQSQLEFYQLCLHLFNYVTSLTIIMLQRLQWNAMSPGTGNANTFIRDENKCFILPVSLCLFLVV